MTQANVVWMFNLLTCLPHSAQSQAIPARVSIQRLALLDLDGNTLLLENRLSR